MNRHRPLSPERIADAARVIDPVFLNSPLIEQPTANAAFGLRVLAKVETLNPIRSFKGRGAEFWMAGQAGGQAPVVAASAGNFGQGLAWAATRRERQATIFAAETANPRKVAAMRRLGAEVRLQGADFDAAKAFARAFAADQGLVFVEDGDDPLIAEGAGTIAKEIVEQAGERAVALDALVVPLGNGALLTGMGTWMRHALPSCRVVGVVAAGAPAMKRSWELGRPQPTESAATIADGIAVREPVAYALACMRDCVDEVVAVDEPAIEAAVAFCREHYGLIVEPAGAAGVAGLLQHGGLFRDRTVATVLCGGNVATL